MFRAVMGQLRPAAKSGCQPFNVNGVKKQNKAFLLVFITKYGVRNQTEDLFIFILQVSLRRENTLYK